MTTSSSSNSDGVGFILLPLGTFPPNKKFLVKKLNLLPFRRDLCLKLNEIREKTCRMLCGIKVNL